MMVQANPKAAIRAFGIAMQPAEIEKGKLKGDQAA